MNLTMEGSAKGVEDVGAKEEGESDDRDSDAVGGDGKVLGFGSVVEAGGLVSREDLGSYRAAVPRVVAEGYPRVSLDSLQKEVVSIFSDKGNGVRLSGFFGRPRSSSEFWCDRFGGDSSWVKEGFGDGTACTSVFVGNIPPSSSHMNLRSWFSAFGRVVDVFVSQRRSKVDGSHFAFARFRNLADAIGACAEVDGVVVEGFKVVENLARFARSRPLSNSSTNVVVVDKACGLNLPSGLSHQSQVGVFGKLSFVQVLISVAKSSGSLLGPNAVLPESGLRDLVEDLAHLDVVYSNNSGSVCISSHQVSESVRFGVANCVSMDHSSETCSGKRTYVEPLDYTGYHSLPFVSQYARGMTEDEIRGGHLMKSCVMLPEKEISAGILDVSIRIDVGKENLSLFDSFDPIAVGLSSHRLGDGVDNGSGFDLRICDGCHFEGCYHSTIIGDGSAYPEYAQIKNGEDVENEVQNVITSLGRVENDEVDNSGTFLKVAGPMSDCERIEFSEHVRFIVHDALQLGKVMGVNFSPRDERMIKRFSVLRQLDMKKWSMRHDDD